MHRGLDQIHLYCPRIQINYHWQLVVIYLLFLIIVLVIMPKVLIHHYERDHCVVLLKAQFIHKEMQPTPKVAVNETCAIVFILIIKLSQLPYFIYYKLFIHFNLVLRNFYAAYSSLHLNF